MFTKFATVFALVSLTLVGAAPLHGRGSSHKSSCSTPEKDNGKASASASATQAADYAKASSKSAPTSSNVQKGGFATFFYQNGNAGECGTVHSDSDLVVAIDAAGWWQDYESNSNGKYCGKYVTIKNTDNGKEIVAMIADVCPTCDTNNSLDLSTGAFNAIAAESDGEVPIEWWFN